MRTGATGDHPGVEGIGLADGFRLTALRRKLGRHRACVVLIGLAVLDELAGLHAAGRWHGGVNARNVLVDAEGGVRLRPSPLRRRKPQQLSDAALRSADVRAAGDLLQLLLRGGPGDRSPAPAGTLETAAQAISRSVARKKVRAGHEASQARLTLWEAAGRLASRQQQAIARGRLADLVAAEVERKATPSTEAVTALISAAGGGAVTPVVRPRAALAGTAALLGILLSCALLAVIYVPGAGARPSGPAAASIALPAPSFRDDRPAPAQAVAPAVPAVAPRSAGDVQAVIANLDARCAPGTVCTMRVEVRLRPATYARGVAWVVRSMDRCTGSSSVLATGELSAEAGWTHVVAMREVRLPAAPATVVALTESPARAASALVPLSDTAGC